MELGLANLFVREKGEVNDSYMKVEREGPKCHSNLSSNREKK